MATLAARADGTPVDETRRRHLDDMIGDYKRSKLLAERERGGRRARGLPVVIVSPSTPVGDGDVKPTPTGKIIVDFLDRPHARVRRHRPQPDRRARRGRRPPAGRPSTGRPGERYILGHRNLTLKELLELLAGIAGVPPPRLRLPHWLPLADRARRAPFARLFGLGAARAAGRRADGAQQDVLRPRRRCASWACRRAPVEGALERAVRFFRDHGYVRAK